MAAEQATQVAADGPETFVNACKNGILVCKGIQMEVGGEMRTYQPGDIIEPDAGDLAGGENSELVQQVAMRNRVSNGRVMTGKHLLVFQDKKDLTAYAKTFREGLLEKQESEARNHIEEEFRRMAGMGMRIANLDALESAMQRVIGEYPEVILSKLRAEYAAAFGFSTAKK